MSTFLDPILFRGVERLITVIFGGLSIYWGFRLFDRVYQTSGELEAKGASFSINLRKVGPGVFFALFGMAIMVSSLTAKLDTTQSRTTSAAQTTSSPVAASSPASSAPGSAALVSDAMRTMYGQGGIMSGRETRLTDAVNTVKASAAYMRRSKQPDEAERGLLVSQLVSTKELLIEELIRPEGVQAFKDLRSRIQKDPGIYKSLSAEAKAAYDRVRILWEE